MVVLISWTKNSCVQIRSQIFWREILPLIFFDLMDMCMVNSHIVYKECYPTGMELLDFKVLIAKSLIGSYNCRKRIAPPTRVSRRSFLTADVPLHLPIIQTCRSIAHSLKKKYPRKNVFFCVEHNCV